MVVSAGSAGGVAAPACRARREAIVAGSENGDLIVSVSRPDSAALRLTSNLPARQRIVSAASTSGHFSRTICGLRPSGWGGWSKSLPKWVGWNRSWICWNAKESVPNAYNGGRSGRVSDLADARRMRALKRRRSRNGQETLRRRALRKSGQMVTATARRRNPTFDSAGYMAKMRA